MLIRLIVENFLSFNEETEFNMLTGEVRRHPHHVFKNRKFSVVKTAVIFGANGAGKSNLILAFDYLKNIVTENGLEDRFKNVKFKFNEDANKPTKIEIDFSIKGKAYNYGLIIDNNSIEEEWLYKLGFGEEDELIFERKSKRGKKMKMKFHADFTADPKSSMLLDILQDEIANHKTSFLYVAKNKIFLDITTAWDWIDSCSEVVFPKGSTLDIRNNYLKAAVKDLLDGKVRFSDFCNSFVKNLDTGICEFAIAQMTLDEYLGNRYIVDKREIISLIKYDDIIEIADEPPFWAFASMENNIPIVKRLVAIHKNDDGTFKQFELSEESDGTLRILELLVLFYDVVYTSKTIFIDEIELNIHPSLLKALIKILMEFRNRKGQLIFTTHESNLLDLDLFRQDEIWFAEKNKKGATELYPLSDYDIRPDLDIRKGYLSGRFGAIPFLANLKDINWEPHAEETKQSL